jgi:hypothetical protein
MYFFSIGGSFFLSSPREMFLVLREFSVSKFETYVPRLGTYVSESGT